MQTRFPVRSISNISLASFLEKTLKIFDVQKNGIQPEILALDYKLKLCSTWNISFRDSVNKLLSSVVIFVYKNVQLPNNTIKKNIFL